MTTTDDFEQAKQIFDQIAELSPEQRSALIEASCAPNTTIRQHLERMLAQFDSESPQYDPPVTFPLNGTESSGHGWFTGTDRFRIRRRLGSGAFGTVFEAYDRDRKTTVALKLLERCKPDSLFRFKREFRALVNTRHENLVHLYELFSEDGHWFFSMEYVDGVDFIEYVRTEDGRCDFTRLREALRQLATAVTTLHAANQLHRDLKPGNVLVTDSGRVAVLDFGLVKQLGEGDSHQSISMVGTPAYMSPEQADRSSVSPASDWYSVGVMLFQALTGRIPHSSSLVERWLEKSGSKVIEPRIVDPDVPTDLNDLCRRLLDRVPENRPTDNEVLHAVAGPPANLLGCSKCLPNV